MTDFFDPLFQSDGEQIIIDAVPMTALVSRSHPVSGPWPEISMVADEPAAPMVIRVHLSDLTAIGQWPLAEPVITIDQQQWSVLRFRAATRLNMVTLYLREAE